MNNLVLDKSLYKQIKNSTVIEILSWEDLKSEIGEAINALGGKIPRPPHLSGRMTETG